jgi:hypothetical protein
MTAVRRKAAATKLRTVVALRNLTGPKPPFMVRRNAVVQRGKADFIQECVMCGLRIEASSRKFDNFVIGVKVQPVYDSQRSASRFFRHFLWRL